MDKFTQGHISVGSILGAIEAKEIAIPEIQRPFVWDGAKVRDLIDSLYNGFPIGYLIIWSNPNVKLLGITSSQLGMITLEAHLDIGDVTEIFVRINSQGKSLNQSDFAMSKIAADEKYGGNLLRKTIDYFCHLSKSSEFFDSITGTDSEFADSEYFPRLKWLKDDKSDIYDPSYDDRPINIFVGEKAPNEYFKTALEQCASKNTEEGLVKTETDFYHSLEVNCLPETIVDMSARDYPDFLILRRKLMAQKIQDYYHKL